VLALCSCSSIPWPCLGGIAVACTGSSRYGPGGGRALGRGALTPHAALVARCCSRRVDHDDDHWQARNVPAGQTARSNDHRSSSAVSGVALRHRVIALLGFVAILCVAAALLCACDQLRARGIPGLHRRDRSAARWRHARSTPTHERAVLRHNDGRQTRGSRIFFTSTASTSSAAAASQRGDDVPADGAVETPAGSEQLTAEGLRAGQGLRVERRHRVRVQTRLPSGPDHAGGFEVFRAEPAMTPDPHGSRSHR